jgi:Mrp family chromosome partitioning ATPase
MTAIDQAFIRAYVEDGGASRAEESALPVPHGATNSQPPEESLVEQPGSATAGLGTQLPLTTATADEAAGVAGEDELQPLLEVDAFAWSKVSTKLSLAAGVQLDRLADALAAGIAEGRKVVGLAGCRRRQGCTTLLLCAARRLAARGLKVVMVDADFDHPKLARRLGLLPESGWEEVLAGELPLAEVLIESLEDRVALLPLPAPLSTESGLPAPAASLDPLRRHYDLVLVDLGEVGAEAAARNWIDAVVLVHDVRSTPRAELVRATRRLQAAGQVELGVAENFV